MVGIIPAVEAAQELVREFSPAPSTFEVVALAQDLKARLDWGEPALTIIDIRDRNAYNQQRIQGAISLPMTQLVGQARQTLDRERDIYLYGDDDQAAAEAAIQLDTAGFRQVAILKGGLSAWQQVGGAVEGTAT